MTKTITVSRACELCSVSRATIWRWVKAGKIKASKTAGGHHRVDEEDLLRFMHEKGMHSQYRNETAGRILVVDDDEMIRKFFNRFLSSFGFELDFAENGFEAGLKTVQFNPHLIILDLIMPEMDGFAVCRQIKQQSGTAGIKIIAISGYNTPENIDRALTAGADIFMPKPIDADRMVTTINDLMAPAMSSV